MGAPGPHDFAVRVCAARQPAHPRPPHSAPRFVTTRNAPHDGAERGCDSTFSEITKDEYFSRGGWTIPIGLMCLDSSDLPVMPGDAPAQLPARPFTQP
jgi:hypothetical protein